LRRLLTQRQPFHFSLASSAPPNDRTGGKSKTVRVSLSENGATIERVLK